MRKILALSAAIASVFAMSAAQAAVLLIDDFNVPATNIQVADYTVTTVGLVNSSNGGVSSIAYDPSNLGAGPSLATSRVITADLTYKPNTLSATKGIVGSVGGGAGGQLDFTVDTGYNGTGTVAWVIPNFLSQLSTPANVYFGIVAAALGASGNINVDFAFTGTGANSGNNFLTSNIINSGFVYSVPGTSLNFGLTDPQATTLAKGGNLVMTLTGGQGWNLTLDQFSINIPEPTSLALVGLALLGAGVVSRRRKA